MTTGYDTNRDILPHRLCRSRTGCCYRGNLSLYFIEGIQTESNRPTDYRITSAEVYGAPCRCRGYQGESALVLIEIDILNLASQEVTTYRGKFPKPVGLYAVLTIFGTNIVASEGEEWKRYRKIAAPAFSEVRPELDSSPVSE